MWLYVAQVVCRPVSYTRRKRARGRGRDIAQPLTPPVSKKRVPRVRVGCASLESRHVVEYARPIVSTQGLVH